VCRKVLGRGSVDGVAPPSRLPATLDKSMFEENWKILRDKLNNLLPLVSGNTSHLLIDRLLSSKKNYEKGKKRLGCAEACYVQFVLEDLDLIKKYDTSQFNYFRRELRRKQLPEETYFGLRLEIRISASLITKNIKFTKSETPDFIINDKQLGIECTSTHISLSSNIKPQEVLYKIQAVINKKNEYEYKTSKTILMIDVSNLLFHEGNEYCNKILADRDNSYPVLEKDVNDSKFFSLIYFSYAWVPVEGSNGATLHNLYYRIDSKKIDKNTMMFLDTHFPLGDIWVEGHLRKIV